MKHERSAKQESHKPQLTPLAKAIRQHRRLMQASLLAASTTLAVTPALAQEAASEELMLEEITVTAQKREQNLQDVPIAVTAFDSTMISDLGLQNFSDFAMMVPNLSYKTTAYQGPSIVMRGASDGGDGNPSGSAPSVAVYLDEAPVSFIGGQLDIHIYDMARIEALAGPQGTLYGASSQTGTVRYITNKPDPTAFAGGADVQISGTKDGDPGYSADGFVNIPLGERAALRLVGWYLEEGGWIDNVPQSAAFAAGPRQNNAGQYEYFITPTGETFINTNDDFVEDDFNELTKTGLRAALGVELSDTWTGTLGLNYQNTDTEGVWEHSPDMTGEGNIQRYSEDTYEDEWTQFTLTVEGKFANHSLVYAGAFMDRETDYNQGYNAYGAYVTWVDYYACDWSYTETDDCTSLEEQGVYPINTDRSSHELRLMSMSDSRLHYTAGLFYENIEIDYDLNFVQPGMSEQFWVNGIEDLYFRTDQTREDTQFAIFGELTYDITDSVSVTGGVRWFDEEATITGVVGYDGTMWSPSPTADTFIDSKASNSDQIFKANVTWNATDEHMFYFTWSEGYRPGGVNREANFEGTPLETYIPDIMTNYEVGWKTTLADGRVRFNGAAYFMDWDDIQFTIYQSDLSLCCGSTYNLSTAEIKGAEFDLTWMMSQSWMLTLAAAYNDAETTDDFILPNGKLSVPDGTPLPNVPEFQGNAMLRYHFELGSTPAFAQLVWSYTGSSTSEIQPDVAFDQASYNFANFRTGIDNGSWGLDLFVNNLTDERADLYIHPRSYAMTTTTNRPRNYGLRFWGRWE